MASDTVHADGATPRAPTTNAGAEIWVVQLDDHGVGFCDARPCKAAERSVARCAAVRSRDRPGRSDEGHRKGEGN